MLARALTLLHGRSTQLGAQFNEPKRKTVSCHRNASIGEPPLPLCMVPKRLLLETMHRDVCCIWLPQLPLSQKPGPWPELRDVVPKRHDPVVIPAGRGLLGTAADAGFG